MNAIRRRMWSGSIVGFFCAVVIVSAAQAHDGYPIALEAKYAEIHRGTSVRRMVFVVGHAHYPDGTVLKVGLRSEGSKQYVDWFDARVRSQSFSADMGPFMKEFCSGSYVIEAWFDFKKQSRAVQDAILKSQEGAEGGIGTCPAERLQKGLACLSDHLFGAAMIAIGSPGRVLMEEEDAQAFLGQVRDGIEGVLKEVREAAGRHAARDKGPELNAEAWQECAVAWRARVKEIDAALLRWNNSKINAPHRPAYVAANTAMVNLEGLLAAHGRELYNLECGFPGGTPESLDAQVVAGLQQLTEDLAK